MDCLRVSPLSLGPELFATCRSLALRRCDVSKKRVVAQGASTPCSPYGSLVLRRPFRESSEAIISPKDCDCSTMPFRNLFFVVKPKGATFVPAVVVGPSSPFPPTRTNHCEVAAQHLFRVSFAVFQPSFPRHRTIREFSVESLSSFATPVYLLTVWLYR